jgi:hypothetical protein
VVGEEMKLIAGSILASCGLLVISLGHLLVNELPPPGSQYVTKYYLALGSPIQVIAILFIIVGIVLLLWGLWDTRTKRE